MARQQAALVNAITGAAIQVLQNSNASANPVSIPPGFQSVIAEQIANRIKATPEMQHVTSTEGFWRSRANWSMLVSLGSTAAGIVAGVSLPPEYNEAMAGGLWTVGCGVAAFLARRARTATRPLGS